MIKKTLFKQAWWVSLAVVLAVLQIVFAVANAGDQDASATERLVIFSVWGGSAALAFIGSNKDHETDASGMPSSLSAW